MPCLSLSAAPCPRSGCRGARRINRATASGSSRRPSPTRGPPSPAVRSCFSPPGHIPVHRRPRLTQRLPRRLPPSLRGGLHPAHRPRRRPGGHRGAPQGQDPGTRQTTAAPHPGASWRLAAPPRTLSPPHSRAALLQGDPVPPKRRRPRGGCLPRQGAAAPGAWAALLPQRRPLLRSAPR